MADDNEQPPDEQADDEDLDEAAAAAAAAVAALAALIGDDVDKALAEDDEERRVALFSALAVTAFTLAYEQAGGTGSSAEEARAYVFSLRPAFGLLQPDGSDAQTERMTDIIAHSATSAATVAAAQDAAVAEGGEATDVKFEWRTMRDDRVRDLHRPVDGQVKAAGEPFDVGGHPQRYPGHPVGPPEAWINCRCFLVPSNVTASVEGEAVAEIPADIPVPEAASDASPGDELVARAFDTDQRKKLADKGQAMPDGSFPIANEEDLRNAIQAIGRAKDPDAAKAHIRKRARALGLSDLIPDSWTASADVQTDGEAMVAWAPSTSPPGTHDAPGWVTNPKETQRLRDYWVKGAGAAKIGWGSPGDLTRCEQFLAKYVGPQYSWGTCQNLHKEALGIWNPESGHGDATAAAIITSAFAAAADLEELMPPSRSLFDDPGLDAPTPLTVIPGGDYDEVVGHLAAPWDTCHVGITGECVNPPRSTTNYAHFRLGEVETDQGPVPVGHITAGTKHAETDLTATDTVRHYDHTGTVVADIAVGEDDHGIWAHGIVRPGVTDDQLYVLRAGTPSGDWRRIGGSLELVGALIVNVPGFPIPRPELAASAGRDLALVAAGVVTIDPNSNDDRIVVAVHRALDERDARQDRARRAVALAASVNPQRVERLLALVEG